MKARLIKRCKGCNIIEELVGRTPYEDITCQHIFGKEQKLKSDKWSELWELWTLRITKKINES